MVFNELIRPQIQRNILFTLTAILILSFWIPTIAGFLNQFAIVKNAILIVDAFLLIQLFRRII